MSRSRKHSADLMATGLPSAEPVYTRCTFVAEKHAPCVVWTAFPGAPLLPNGLLTAALVLTALCTLLAARVVPDSDFTVGTRLLVLLPDSLAPLLLDAVF